jgi:2'-5' RNA ligase
MKGLRGLIGLCWVIGRQENAMSEQALLPGFEPVAPSTDRLLFLIYPDTVARWPISRLARHCRDELNLHGRPLETDIFHATLVHLGDFPGLPHDIVARAVQAAAKVQMAPFEVSFDRVKSFSRRPGKRPLVLHSGEDAVPLMTFQQALVDALIGVKLARSGASKFRPHVTLLYDRKEVDDHVVDTVGWTVREFVLVHSLLGQARHDVLARWPLVG